ncbi:MAG TPA: DMT family transporter [Xanthobacteraceae bacterium]
MSNKPLLTPKYATAWGVACGAGAALFWALGFVAARQGVTSGLSPVVIALHRFLWPGFALLPLVAKNNFADLRVIGLGRGAALALFGGLPLALLSYVGYILVPLGHGAVIQPSCAALGGLVLSRLVLKEPLPPRRIVGAAAIVIGLAVIGAEALRTIGAHGVLGDLLFVAAGSCFAIFGVLVRHWRVGAIRAAAVTSVLSLAGLPILLFNFGDMLAAGFYENAMQAVVQGALAGAGAIYLFTRAGGFARCESGGAVSLAGAAVHATDRLSHDRRDAEHFAARRACYCNRRLSADTKGLTSGNYAALRDVRNSPMRSSAFKMFSVELA